VVASNKVSPVANVVKAATATHSVAVIDAIKATVVEEGRKAIRRISPRLRPRRLSRKDEAQRPVPSGQWTEACEQYTVNFQPIF
jgi:hypothetical protein